MTPIRANAPDIRETLTLTFQITEYAGQPDILAITDTPDLPPDSPAPTGSVFEPPEPIISGGSIT
ncbi:hypothetical protein [Nocardia arizonensis]|uniref:hypothetical protein n=1 Tax=Nocardia arizonensis TaxID=1141647 RepID=UPI0006D100CB|nr:hypothetical protein [Nocardia arizonensis]